MSKPKIVILGGGVAAVTAAYFLSGSKVVREPTTSSSISRAGGWAGRARAARTEDQRIEEHGLHVWFGYYENAFRLLRDCHAELNTLAERRKPALVDDYARDRARRSGRSARSGSSRTRHRAGGPGSPRSRRTTLALGPRPDLRAARLGRAAGI